MLKAFFAILLLVALAVCALSVRLFFGRRFVHTDIKGNKALEQRGIRCAVEQEMEIVSQQET
ncbi:MAG: hypothetical protein J6M53_02545 [Bacteroidaceae bacterium]|nr:hypothetical protein [Bacteroidaceae bacterium]